MVLECFDRLFSFVLLMVVGWDELVCHVVGLDGFFEVVGAFIVKDILLGCNSDRSKLINEYLVCADYFY